MTHASLADLAGRGMFFLPDHDLYSSAFTVGEQLEMIRAQFDGDDPSSCAERLGIAQCLKHEPARVSGGERRRAELAAMLVRRPTVGWVLEKIR